MKKTLKIVSILMMAIIMVMVATPVFASNTVDQINIIDPGTNETADILELVGKILGFLRWAAIIGGVLIITILGIKYMMGSLEEKAEYKKSMIPLIVGIVVIMGATSIASILFDTFALDK